MKLITLVSSSKVVENYDTLFLLIDVYPKNKNLNTIMNELSDKVTTNITKYNLSYIEHGIRK